MPAIATPAERRVLRRNISWETFDRLLGECVENRGTRFTYDEGNLEISNSSLPRFPIFAAVGVAEFWRYDGERVRFYKFEGKAYRQIDESIVLPPMTAAQATVFVERSRHENAVAWVRAVQAWVRNTNRVG